MSMSIRCLLLAGLACLGLVVACGDDDEPTAPVAFAVTIEVVDAQGTPVPDLDVALAPDTPFYGEKRAVGDPEAQPRGLSGPFPVPFYPAVEVPFDLPAAGDAVLAIDDVAGEEFRLLIAAPLDAGRYAVVWDGLDEFGVIVPSGVYHAHLVVRDPETSEVLIDDRRPMLLARLDVGDTGIGVTDAEGRLELTDRRLFPFLFDVEPFDARDETGEVIGQISLAATMRFYLSDPLTGQRMRFDRDVTGPADFEFVWDPAP